MRSTWILILMLCAVLVAGAQADTYNDAANGDWSAADTWSPTSGAPPVSGDTVIPESEVIVEFLEDVEPDVSLLPSTPEGRAQARLLARIGDLYIMVPLGKLFGQINPQGRDAKLVKDLFGELDKGLGWLAHYLDGSKYAVDGELSIADCALIPMLFFASKITPLFGRDCVLCDAPKVHDYFHATLEDEAVARVHKELEQAFDEMMGR